VDVSGPCTVAQLLRRQEVTYEMLLDSLDLEMSQDTEIIEEIEIQVKYSGYIKRQLQQIGRFKKLEKRVIPDAFSYDRIVGFSQEVREKLKRVRPASIGQASRISGVTPAAISLLIVALEKHTGEASPDEVLDLSS
jgi:tRNA uridine 5-carboxymethylaminomethyl modification enzyme